MWNKRRCWFEPQSKSVKQLCLYSGVFKFVIWSNFWSVSVCLLWIYGNSISHNCHHCILRFNHLLGVCCPFASVAKKKAQKIQFDQFLIYIAVAFSAVFLFWFVDYPPNALTMFRSFEYYIMSIVAAFIYWFWDSIFLRN